MAQEQNTGSPFKTPFGAAAGTAQPFGAPGQNGAIGRALGFARAISGKTVLLVGGVLILQAVMPDGRRPSDLIGSLTGLIHSSELNAARDAQSLSAGQIAEAQARAQTQWAIEQETARQQQEAILQSLQAKEAAANVADGICLGGPLMGALFGHDAADLVQAAKGACGEAARLRREIVAEQAEAARLGSALMQRGSAPGAAPRK